MGKLNEILEDALATSLSKAAIYTFIIGRGISRAGINIDTEAVLSLRQHLAEQMESSSSSGGMPTTIVIPSTWIEQHIPAEARILFDSLTLSDHIPAIEDFRRAIEEGLEKAALELVNQASKLFLSTWKLQAPEVLREERGEATAFGEVLSEHWGTALQHYEMLLSLCQFEGSKYNQTTHPISVPNQVHHFEALTRLHARAVLTGREVLILLRHGLADGAYARCRTLYELGIISAFIREHEPHIAEAYLLHAAVRSYKELKYPSEAYEVLNYRPPSKRHIERSKRLFDRLLKQFGKAFEHDYGWATKALPNVRGRITLHDLASSLKMDHFKLLFQQTSENIHAGARGIDFQLGLPPSENIILAGPSVFGLGEPLRAASHFLLLVTAQLLLNTTDLDSIAKVLALKALVVDIHEASYRVECLFKRKRLRFLRAIPKPNILK